MITDLTVELIVAKNQLGEFTEATQTIWNLT